MIKKFKSLRIIFLAIFILVFLAAVMANLIADNAVRVRIETAATKALNVGVSVSNVHMSVFSGKLFLRNLLVSNPPGYQHDRFVDLKNASLEVEIKSIFSDVVNIRELKFNDVSIVLEQRSVSNNNLLDIIKGIPPASGKKLRVDVLEISNITVRMKNLPVEGQEGTIELKLSPIKMTHLGRDGRLDTAGLFTKILLAIVNGVAEQGVGVMPKDIAGAMKSTLGKTLNLGIDIMRSTENIGKEIAESLKEMVKPKKEE